MSHFEAHFDHKAQTRNNFPKGFKRVFPYPKIQSDSISTRLFFTELSQHRRHWKAQNVLQRFSAQNVPTSDLRFVIRNPNPSQTFWPQFYPLSPWARFSHIFIFFLLLFVFLSFLLETFAHIKAQHLQQRSTSFHQHHLLNSSILFYFVLCFVFYFHTYFPQCQLLQNVNFPHSLTPIFTKMFYIFSRHNVCRHN